MMTASLTTLVLRTIRHQVASRSNLPLKFQHSQIAEACHLWARVRDKRVNEDHKAACTSSKMLRKHRRLVRLWQVGPVERAGRAESVIISPNNIQIWWVASLKSHWTKPTAFPIRACLCTRIHRGVIHELKKIRHQCLYRLCDQVLAPHACLTIKTRKLFQRIAS